MEKAMADESEPNAPEGFPQNTSSTQESRPSGEVRRCTLCDGPVKGHFGPCGPAKCIFGLLNKSSRWIDALETELETSNCNYDKLDDALETELETSNYNYDKLEKLMI